MNNESGIPKKRTLLNRGIGMPVLSGLIVHR
jgi:hypothetical protein